MRSPSLNRRRTFTGQALRKQSGLAAVEFALIAPLLFTLLFGIIEMGRVFFYMNTAAEATSIGARIAVVCNMDAAVIKNKMRAMLPILTSNNNIVISYLPAGCSTADCTSVTVSIAQGANKVPITTYIPYVPLSISLPPYPTTLRREGLDSTNNPICS
jgi:Flp pilus assembly protein TadG